MGPHPMRSSASGPGGGLQRRCDSVWPSRQHPARPAPARVTAEHQTSACQTPHGEFLPQENPRLTQAQWELKWGHCPRAGVQWACLVPSHVACCLRRGPEAEALSGCSDPADNRKGWACGDPNSLSRRQAWSRGCPTSSSRPFSQIRSSMKSLLMTAVVVVFN